MKKFLILYRSTVSAKEQMKGGTPEQAKAGMDAWRTWAQKTGAALVDLGAPLGEPAVLQGTAAPGFIGGYSIVQAESLASARRLFEGHPYFRTPGASIELLELLAMPGM
jgi:hypothetical protein